MAADGVERDRDDVDDDDVGGSVVGRSLKSKFNERAAGCRCRYARLKKSLDSPRHTFADIETCLCDFLPVRPLPQQQQHQLQSKR